VKVRARQFEGRHLTGKKLVMRVGKGKSFRKLLQNPSKDFGR
jgi:hypothetical protein